MFSSRTFIFDAKDIPSNWIFETYINLPVKLTGQNIKIHSVFKKERTPSMHIKFNTNVQKYFYKCYSTGKKGNSINLVMELLDIDYFQALNKIKTDYQEFLKTNNSPEKLSIIESYNINHIEESNWKAINIKVRKWNRLDVEYWTSYNIYSDILNEYNVKPIQSYTFQKISKSGEVLKSFDVYDKQYIYGYFKNNGELYKIYNPKNKKQKFIKLKPTYVQGEEQLKGYDVLVIMASLKDIMSISNLGLNIDFIAPDSENTLLDVNYINKKKEKYKYIISLLDNDKAGINAMKKYIDKFNIPMCYVPIENDIADLSKNKGEYEALCEIVPRIGKIIENLIK